MENEKFETASEFSLGIIENQEVLWAYIITNAKYLIKDHILTVELNESQNNIFWSNAEAKDNLKSVTVVKIKNTRDNYRSRNVINADVDLEVDFIEFAENKIKFGLK